MPSVLISEAQRFSFRIENIEAELETLQKLVGGYIEAVTDSQNRWHLYCDEEGKLKGKPTNRFSTMLVDEYSNGFVPFSAHDHLVGTIVWLGPTVEIGDDSDEYTVHIDVITKYANIVLAATDSDRPIVVVRWGNDIWVFDTPQSGPVARIKACVEAARLRVADDQDHGIIEVFANLDRGYWQEMRVDIMDAITIDLHDEREDRSYG